MANGDTARHYYSVMRSEVVEHIRLRDQSLFVYLGASGVIMGIGLGAVLRLEALLIIPMLGLGVCYIMNQHDIHISAICSYLVDELDAFLAEQQKIPQWDSSASLAAIHPCLVRFRYQGHLTILLLPITVALGANYRQITFSSPIAGIAWWLGVAAGIMVVLMTLRTKRLRGQPGK